jgi:hypothetical protein
MMHEVFDLDPFSAKREALFLIRELCGLVRSNEVFEGVFEPILYSFNLISKRLLRL